MRSLFFLLLYSALLFTNNSSAQVTFTQIGKNYLLPDVRGFEYLGNTLFYLDLNLALKKIDLQTGEQTKLGTVGFKKAEFFFQLNAKLYIVEFDGSLTEIDSQTGEWKLLTTMGVWSRIKRVLVVRNTLYTIENGALYRHRSVNVDDRTPIGSNNFYFPDYLIRGESTLYSLQSEGSLYQIDLSTGEWKKISKSKQWKNTGAAAILGTKLYTIDQAGNFCETNLLDGTKTLLDSTQFVEPRLLFATAGKLFYVNVSGNLYQLSIASAKKE